MKQHLWKILLIWGGLLIVLYAFHLSPFQESLLLVSFDLFALLSMAWSLWNYRPKPILAWGLLALGQPFIAMGDILFANTYAQWGLNTPEWGSFLFFSLGMVCSSSGLVILFFKFAKTIRQNDLINGVIVATGLAVFIWVMNHLTNIPNNLIFKTWIDNILFMLGLLILGVITSVFLMTPIGHTWCYRFLYLALLFYTMGFYFYGKMLTEAPPITYWPYAQQTTLYNLFYSIAYLLTAAAYLHPSIATLHAAQPDQKSVISKQDLFILGIAFIIDPVAYWFKSLSGIEVNIWPIFAAMTLIFLLVELRLVLLVRLLEVQNRHLGQQQTRLQYQAYHDSLTRLPNRFSLNTHLQEATERARINGVKSTFLMIDLNHFKLVNDTLGHDQGDLVLRQIANKLIKIKRKTDMVSRWGWGRICVCD